MRYEADEPFLGTRIEVMGALVAATLANVNRGRGQLPFSAEEFMPWLPAMQEQEAAERRRQAIAGDADAEDAILQRLVLAGGGDLG
jgi:hypothetical protein